LRRETHDRQVSLQSNCLLAKILGRVPEETYHIENAADAVCIADPPE
jgi:hypothetical protein